MDFAKTAKTSVCPGFEFTAEGIAALRKEISPI